MIKGELRKPAVESQDGIRRMSGQVPSNNHHRLMTFPDGRTNVNCAQIQATGGKTGERKYCLFQFDDKAHADEPHRERNSPLN